MDRNFYYDFYTFSYFLVAAIGGWLYDNIGKAMSFYLNTIILVIGSILVMLVLIESHPVTDRDQQTQD